MYREKAGKTLSYVVFIFYQAIAIAVFAAFTPVWTVLAFFYPRWRNGWKMRLGFVPEGRCDVLFYAPSVGEALSAVRLASSIRSQYPNLSFAGACMTPEGRSIIKREQIFENSFIFPVDIFFCALIWLRRISPKLVVVVEGEMWPAFLMVCKLMKISVVAVAARAGNRRRKFHWLLKLLIYASREAVAGVALYSHRHMDYYRSLLGSKVPVVVGGTLKLRDGISPSASKLFETVWISLHPGEFKLLKEFLNHSSLSPSTSHVVAPRYVNTSAKLVELLKTTGRKVISFSCAEGRIPTGEGVIFVLDVMGKLREFIPLAKVAVVGGSFVKRGAHNVYEPLSACVPVVVGPYHWNYEDEVSRGVRQGCVVVAYTCEDVVSGVNRLTENVLDQESFMWIHDVDGLENTVKFLSLFLAKV